MSYLRYLCLFGSSLPPVVCRKAIRLIYIICVCLVRLYLQLFVVGLIRLIYIICVCLVRLYLQLFVGRLCVLFTLFVFVWFVFTSSCL